MFSHGRIKNMETHNTNTSNKFVRVALVVGLVIVINLFLNYTLSVVYKEPTYDQFFARPQVVESYATKESCLSVGGQWSENAGVVPQMGTPDEVRPIKVGEKNIQGYCDPNYTMQKEYDAKRKAYELNVFITLILCGIVLTIVGIVRRHPILSPALTWAGVLSYIIAAMRYWGTATSILKVVILGIALIALIWIAVKKYND